MSIYILNSMKNMKALKEKKAEKEKAEKEKAEKKTDIKDNK